MIGMTTIELLNVSQLFLVISGVIILSIWFARALLGRNALSNSQARRNNMHPAIPLLLILAYFLLSAFIAAAGQVLLRFKEDGWQLLLTSNIAMSASGIIIFITGLFMVRQSFARSLNGLGLNPKTILRDIGGAILNYWAILPLLYALAYMTEELGKYFLGPQFQFGQHPALKDLTNFSNNLPLIISIFIMAVVIAPFVEELIFRGLLQTTLRSFGLGPWLAIIISSFFFIIFHYNQSHWPALFALSIGLGYSYEKSGSLFRPILFHIIFNAYAVIGTIMYAKSIA